MGSPSSAARYNTALGAKLSSTPGCGSLQSQRLSLGLRAPKPLTPGCSGRTCLTCCHSALFYLSKIQHSNNLGEKVIFTFGFTSFFFSFFLGMYVYPKTFHKESFAWIQTECKSSPNSQKKHLSIQYCYVTTIHLSHWLNYQLRPSNIWNLSSMKIGTISVYSCFKWLWVFISCNSHQLWCKHNTRVDSLIFYLCLEGWYDCVEVQAALEHRSAGEEFERESEVKETKKETTVTLSVQRLTELRKKRCFPP